MSGLAIRIVKNEPCQYATDWNWDFCSNGQFDMYVSEAPDVVRDIHKEKIGGGWCWKSNKPAWELPNVNDSQFSRQSD